MKREDYEIMAPVGSYESLMAAIQGGADSVYFGIEKMNMRAHSSNNFTFDDLENIVKICNKNNLKSYLTVNTVIYDKELDLMREIVDATKKNNITAIIASDISVINYARKIGVEVHISTQLNVSNIESLKFFAQFADVVVLARELSLNQVAEISKAIIEENITGPSGNLVKIEMFIHGALCYSISGRCYWSSWFGGKSSLRGRCVQPCRRMYEQKGQKKKAFLLYGFFR